MIVFRTTIILIEFSSIVCQLVFSSLTIPNRDSPSSFSNSHHPSSPIANYYFPNSYYHHLAFNDSDAIPDEQRLMAQLLKNYDPSARPVYNASNTVSVAFGIALTQLSDMVRFERIKKGLVDQSFGNDQEKKFFFVRFQDEKNQVLTTNIWLEQVRESFSKNSFNGRHFRNGMIND